MVDFENAIEIKSLTKAYDGFTLNNINFNVPKGSIMGFIGQNGAGKTTTIKLILNLLKRDSGEIKILGMDNISDEYEIKSQIAAVFDELPFHDDFLDRFTLSQKKKIRAFSKGMKMKLQIAAALSHKARLLIMDEATTGLDPVVRNEILDIFLEYLQDENNSILMSSHITTDLEKIADSVTFIDKGKILLSGYKDDILESHGLIKCRKSDCQYIESDDIVSTRMNDFGAEIMVHDRRKCLEKYSGAVIDSTTLEEIMLFYVRRDKKEWF